MYYTPLLLLVSTIVYALPMDSIQTPAQDSRLYIKREVSGEHSGAAVMRPYVNDNSPSQTTIVQWFDPSYGPNSNAVASMQIKASVPSVSLDNLDGLDSITCSGSLVTVSLKSVTDILTWEDRDILLVIGSHHHCGPDHTDVITMLLASSWYVDSKASTVVFNTMDPEAAGVTGEYNIYVSFIDDTAASPSEPDQSEDLGYQELEKRQSDTDAATPDTAKLAGNQQFNGNLFRSAGTKTIANIPRDCKGKFPILLRTFGSLFKKPAISFTWSARVDIQSKMDFSAETEKGSETADPAVVGGPINPYTVPGVLDTTSKLSINACVDKELRDQAVNLPDVISSFSKLHDQVKSLESASTNGPEEFGQADTIANAHYKANAVVSLMPQLALQIQVFGTNIISTTIDLKPTAEFNYEKGGHGVTAGTTGARGFCMNLKLSAAFQAQILQGTPGQCSVAGGFDKKTIYRS
ncbi:hypothetical protein BASA50_001099 [Batrachochytrium salamandrivorans]|uniref:Uncharacterized protein n=1 Tax=Batrachochytrium salamandrivorans TaxID=1357716 RepID=A0ABQ8ERM9_9FUNG|nr:hypothetical protein BASA50_001099 [Batrachochytrium salamandrivorans]KAH6602014.1 hypothetical protein BASA61_001540 [Batrachochytrium salamandrivorans]